MVQERTLGTPADSTFGEGSFTSLTSTTKVTDAIDSLNETMENIRNNTYVKSVTFTADDTTISSGDTITLTITPTGNATRYDITWGDGGSVQTINDSGSSTTTQDSPIQHNRTNFNNGESIQSFSGSDRISRI